MKAEIPPANVQGNIWTSLKVPEVDEFIPSSPVSVVITYFEAPEALNFTIAALERQTFPADLTEVIVVDDGSAIPLQDPKNHRLNLRVVHQEDLGFGLARARNTGVKASSHDIVIFLDCDMLPEQDWLMAHARWHHIASDILTLGFRAHVNVDDIEPTAIRERSGSLAELFSDRPSTRPRWIENHMSRTNDLTSDDDDIFRVVTGGNLGISKQFFRAVGGYDESFTQWGAEDTEFGYRAYTRGGVLVPERSAMCWHQGEGATPSESESQSLELQRAKISQLIAHRGFRTSAAGRSFMTPQYVVTVGPAEASPDAKLSTVEQVLANSIHDLVVWIEEAADLNAIQSREHERIRRLLAGDPRVSFGASGGAIDAFPGAAFHVFIPSNVGVGINAIRSLRHQLDTAPAASINIKNPFVSVSIFRAWVLHRASRRGCDVTHVERITQLEHDRLDVTLGSTVLKISSDVHQAKSLQVLLRRTRRYRHRLSRYARRSRSIVMAIKRELFSIRSLSDVRYFLSWSYRSVRIVAGMSPDEINIDRKSARRRNGFTRGRLGKIPRDRRLAQYRLGPEIATVGNIAEAIFRSAARVTDAANERTQVTLTDATNTDTETGRQKAQSNGLTISVSDLSRLTTTPAFDVLQFNPRRWSAESVSKPTALPAASRCEDLIRKLKRLRTAHHLIDSPSNHNDSRSRAALLAAVTATGAVVYADDQDSELEELLGSEMFSLITNDRIRTANRHQRERFSIAMRRCSLRDHTLRARSRQIFESTSLYVPPLPTVSILLATRRPHRLRDILAAIESQTYPELELVLAAHGDGFPGSHVDELVDTIECPARVVRVDAREPLGVVLNAAAEAATGSLLAKFDDDDYYGPEHIWDLVLAQEYSQEWLVGKAAEYVYLASSDQTIHRFPFGAERRSKSIAGGAMLVTRHALDAVAGWRQVPSRVDQSLIADVIACGGAAYRTHGQGYMLTRHHEAHTWSVPDSYFLKQAAETREGCDLDFAGIA